MEQDHAEPRHHPDQVGPDHTDPAGGEPQFFEAEIVAEGLPRWGPWATIGLTLAFVVACLVVDTVVVTAFVVPAFIENPKLDVAELTRQLESSGLLLSVVTMLRVVCCATLIPLFIVVRRRLSVRQYLGLVPVGGRTMAVWLGVVLIFAACSDGLTYVLGLEIVPEFMLEVWRTSAWPPLLWLALIVGAPLIEETVFRGFLFVGLQQFRHGNILAVAVTSALWASFHLQYDLYQITVIFFIGIMLGIARIRSGSLWVPLAMHALINLLATVEVGVKIYVLDL